MTSTSSPLTRIFPHPAAPTKIADAYDVERLPHPGRPWVGLCMVSSLDGSIAVDGASGGLGNPNDLEILLTMRALADVVIVGSGTVSGEGYGTPASGTRVGVVTNSGSIDPTIDLFRSGAGFVITNERATVEGDVEILRVGDDQVDLVAAVARITEIVPDARHVQAEGGATLNGALLDADLVDELQLTVSPMLVGGDGPRVTSGATEMTRGFELAHILTDADGYLFTRYVRR
jgi:riboflavin biosynthesis pyrimidine reductase